MTQINHRQVIIDALLKRDGDNCQLCEEPFKPYAPPPIDHIIASSVGGPHSLDNLQLAHSLCNISKGNRPMSQLVYHNVIKRRDLAEAAIKDCAENKMAAARKLRISVRTLYRWIALP